MIRVKKKRNNFYFKLDRSRKVNTGLKKVQGGEVGVLRLLMCSPKQGSKSRNRTPQGQMSKKRVARVRHKLLGSQCRVESLSLLLISTYSLR